MTLIIENLHLSDIQAATELIQRSFSKAVAPSLSAEGIERFSESLTYAAINQRITSGNTFIACKEGSILVGIAELRNENHLNLLFVEPHKQRGGIGRMLFNTIQQQVHKNIITVNASLNAVAAYKQYGFQKIGEKQERLGICYQPMVYVKPA